MPGRAKTGCVRDLHLRHTLKSLARDASEVLADLVEGGQEIPYELSEPADGFALCHYQPLTARFVRDNASELRELASFREAGETMRRADVAGTYLEEAGISPPPDATERADLAVTYFLARLWDGCADFDLDEDRFSATIAEIEDCAEPEAGEIEAIVPLVGFQMATTRLDLSGASIVRADAVDVPADAARGERPSGAAWEPTFLISARVSLDPDGSLGGAGERVAQTFERVVTTLRLHKSGGVGLAPHGWVRVAGDRWRRIATGAGRPRPGGYRLTEQDLLELPNLARTVSVHPRRIGRLRRALLRFEAGLDRRGAIDALNDHLLALRFLLEGEGPAGVGLPMRVAALTQDSEHRTDAKQVVEQALALERELWSGEPARVEGAAGPSEVAARVEELLRTVLRRGVVGELGSDLRAAADETLLADGLAFGEGAADERGATTEWDLEPVAESDLDDLVAEEDYDIPDAERIRVSRGGDEPIVEEVPPLAGGGRRRTGRARPDPGLHLRRRDRRGRGSRLCPGCRIGAGHRHHASARGLARGGAGRGDDGLPRPLRQSPERALAATDGSHRGQGARRVPVPQDRDQLVGGQPIAAAGRGELVAQRRPRPGGVTGFE